MAKQVNIAFVKIWNMLVGAVSWDAGRDLAVFEYDPGFLNNNLDIAPLIMPLEEALNGKTIYEFPGLSKQTFWGMPGLLADSLPDTYGNAIINAWLAEQGRTPDSFNPVERLCYTGKRAMGALEYAPAINNSIETSVPVEIAELVNLSQQIIDERLHLNTNLKKKDATAMLDIIRVGTSAGGARPKAVIAINDKTNEVRSGQVAAPAGFEHWIIKFDSVSDLVLGNTAGYGRIEYAYYKMALTCGIEMMSSKIYEENNRAHFLTKRFDRTDNQGKVHMQSLCAINHFDYNMAGAYSYEQTFQTIRELRLTYINSEQLYRRMVFNVIARNHDDHTKNIAFLMDKNGQWQLAPAFDVIYSYNPEGMWTNQHQMTINGKRRDITRADLEIIGRENNIKQFNNIIDDISAVITDWPKYAEEAGIPEDTIKAIAENLLSV
ncbi:type II toxin-antitoxin system HipA family toxin [Candidatus Margulisiibacteriota bacterium]